MGWHELCNDMKRDILKLTLEDTRGNVTVPGLVLGTRLRAVCKDVAKQVAAVETPYDGQVSYEGSWATRFVGGLRFGDPPDRCNGKGFWIVRDANSGHVFACTAEAVQAGNGCELFRVNRLWPLWRLAQLLNGHCADLSKQLRDHLAITANYEVWINKLELMGPRLREGAWDVMRTHGQIETISHSGLDTPPHAHADDFVSHVARKPTITGRAGHLPMTSELVLATALDYGYELLHLTPQTRCDSPVLDVDGCDTPELCAALGWYDEGKIVQATGWMTSLYCHGRKGVPTRFTYALSYEQLTRMAHIALRRSERRDRVQAESAQLAEAPTRRPRGAALKAKRRMNDQMMCDAFQDSKGRLQSWMQPKESRKLEQEHGAVDDQYASPGEMPLPDVDSDTEFGDDELSPRERAAKRAKDHAAAVAAAMQDYADMLMPSDDEL